MEYYIQMEQASIPATAVAIDTADHQLQCTDQAQSCIVVRQIGEAGWYPNFCVPHITSPQRRVVTAVSEYPTPPLGVVGTQGMQIVEYFTPVPLTTSRESSSWDLVAGYLLGLVQIPACADHQVYALCVSSEVVPACMAQIWHSLSFSTSFPFSFYQHIREHQLTKSLTVLRI